MARTALSTTPPFQPRSGSLCASEVVTLVMKLCELAPTSARLSSQEISDAFACSPLLAVHRGGRHCRRRLARTHRRVRGGLLPGPSRLRLWRAADSRKPSPEGSVFVLGIGRTRSRSLVSIPPNDRAPLALSGFRGRCLGLTDGALIVGWFNFMRECSRTGVRVARTCCDVRHTEPCIYSGGSVRARVTRHIAYVGVWVSVTNSSAALA